MSTCAYWYGVLSSNNFIRIRRFHMNLENICYRDGSGIGLWNARHVQRFKAFRFSDTTIPQSLHKKYMTAVRAFLSQEQIMSQVEELHLELQRSTEFDLFDNSETWHFPKLNRIVDHYSTIIRKDGSVAIDAPNLNQLELIEWNDTVDSYVHETGERYFETCIANKSMLYRTILDGTFNNLHSLKIDTGNFCRKGALSFDFNNYGPIQKMPQLKYLEMHDLRGRFRSTYEQIFRATVNLETLVVYDIIINTSAFNAIGAMKHLKKLSFLALLSNFYLEREKISLPKLEKLTTHGITCAYLANLPNLKSLCIKNPCRTSSDLSYIKFVQPLLGAIHQVETLHLQYVSLDERLFSVLPAFKSLKTLKLTRMIMVSSSILRVPLVLFSELGTLSLYHTEKGGSFQSAPPGAAFGTFFHEFVQFAESLHD